MSHLSALRRTITTAIMILAITVIGLVAPANIQAQDDVGIYWDAGFTSNVASTASIPGAITGYLVLHNQTGTGGVLGWEACIEIEGPASFAGWDFQGQAINAGTAPCFAVGYTSPLPAGNDIVLATFNLVATDTGPITITMKPDWFASLPGQLSYIPGDDPENLLAMHTVTGIEAVAGLNGGNPGVIVGRESINFGTITIGTSRSEILTVTNNGNTPLSLDLSVTDLCSYFTLPGGTGVRTVPANSLLHIEVVFTPIQTRQVFCTLYLGPNLNPVSLTGTGAEPLPSWDITGSPIFPSTEIGQQSSLDFSIINTGTIAFDIDINLPAYCEAFTLISGGGLNTLAPNEQADFTVVFAPLYLGTYVCYLSFGNSLIGDLTIQGGGLAIPPSWDAPTTYQFPEQAVGSPVSTDIIITNTGNIWISLLAALPGDCTDFAITGGGGIDALQPGQSHTVTVEFLALEAGHFECLLDLGSVVPAVHLFGDAVAVQSDLTITPSQLEFIPTAVGENRELNVTVTNIASSDIPLEVQIFEQNSPFTVVNGGGVQVLNVGASLTIVVRFTPTVSGYNNGFLILGENQDTVPLSGIGYYSGADCEVATTTLNFGEVSVGNTRYRYVDVTNNSPTALIIEPQSSASQFTVSSAPVLVAPNATTSVQVGFRPTSTRNYNGTISLGDGSCADIQCYGTGTPQYNSYQDLLGIYWDPSIMLWETWASETNAVITGYLMLSYPSTGTGVSAWECQVGVYGPATILSWQLEGQTINLGSGNNFVVGLASPLPFMGDHALLATFEVLYTDMWENAFFSVTPVYQSSIPDHMAWVPDNDPDALLPMFPRGGTSEVALIGPGSPVGIEAPTPLAQLLGNQVDLSWPAPTGDNEGCHVYRRITGEDAVRLTDEPIITTTTDIVFTDVTTSLPGGSKLFYSYAIVRDGTELARSPEVEITLPKLPDAVTRLLPNVPNPFNPMTEIRFELGKAQSVSVKIYDVTGRLVRELTSSSLPAGPHSYTWQGRDNSGRQVPSGAYYVRLVTNGFVDNRKIMLLK